MAPKVKYRMDLAAILDRVYSGRSPEFRSIARQAIHDMDFKTTVGRMAAEEIQDRTESGIDMRGRQFKSYADSYIESDTFKIYGKSGRVNLVLTGEMLSSLAPRPLHGRPQVVIEVEGEANDRAHGHMNGIPSKKHGLVKREFLGLPESVEDKIFKDAMRVRRDTMIDVTLDLPPIRIQEQPPLVPRGTIELDEFDE